MEIVHLRDKLTTLVESGPEIGEIRDDSPKSSKKKSRKRRKITEVTNDQFSELEKECNLGIRIRFFDCGKLWNVDKSKEVLHIRTLKYEWKNTMDHLDEDVMKEIYQQASPAGYGNRKSGDTEFDIKVRKAVEFTTKEFTLSSELLKQVHQAWTFISLIAKAKGHGYIFSIKTIMCLAIQHGLFVLYGCPRKSLTSQFL
jgi:hypothetical protein